MVRAGLAAAGALLTLSIWLGGPPSAAAAELPVRKAGLWEIKIKLTGGAAPTAMMRHCTDESTDRQMITMFNPLAPPPCSKSDTQKQDSGFAIDSTCRIDNKTITLHSDVTGETKTQEPDSEPTVSSMTLEGRYVGACKWGQKPGDVVMAGGLKVNVKEMDKFREMLKR
jgi:Protein of unknown function (DUF3617)